MRLSAETYQRMRARIDDGRIQCGSHAHAAVMDFEQRVKELSGRDQQIVRLALRGFTHASIADAVGLSRPRVSNILGDVLGVLE